MKGISRFQSEAGTMLSDLQGEQAREFQERCEISFWSVDLDSQLCQVGPGWEEWLGLSSASRPVNLPGWLELFHPVDRADLEALLQQPRSQRAVALEVRMRHRDGNWRWFRLKGRAGRDLHRLAGIAEEITRPKGLALRAEERRKAAEEALRRNEELYRGLYEHSTEHLFSVAVDGQGQFRYEGLNPAHQRATGLREADLVGKRPHECLPQAVADHVEANYRRCWETGQTYSYEEELDLPNGRINWLTQLIPLLHHDGSIARLFGICTDLTRLKDQEKALRLAHRQESIGRLTSGIAHDFNNLLTVIICQLDLMGLELIKNPEMTELIGEIGEAARRAAELTRGLLAYAAGSEGKRSPQQPFQLVTRFQRVLKNLVGPRVELCYALESRSSILAVPVHLHQLLLNLVGNASEAIGSEPGTITVSLSDQELGASACQSLFPSQQLEPGEYVTLEVRDDGPGISQETVASIFEAGVSSKGEGRGLGLATVRDIVRSMGGGLTLHSQPGHGTAFKLFFPRCGAAPLEAAEVQSAVASPPLQGRALYCSGEPAFRRTLKEMCNRLSLDSQETTGPSELLSLLARSPEIFDILILDVADKLTQDQVLQALPALKPEARVLLMSHLPAGELLLGNSYGAPSAFLSKPFEMVEFERCLRRLLPPL